MGAIKGKIKECTLQDILAGKTKLPLENKQAMIYLQDRERHLRIVKELSRAGQRPSIKRDNKDVKVFFRSDIKT